MSLLSCDESVPQWMKKPGRELMTTDFLWEGCIFRQIRGVQRSATQNNQCSKGAYFKMVCPELLSTLKPTQLIKVDLGLGPCSSQVHTFHYPSAKVILAKETHFLPVLRAERRDDEEIYALKTIHLQEKCTSPTCLPL